MTTRYQVTGPGAFMGHKSGEQFDADLTPEQEARAKARGSIRVVKRDDSEKTSKPKGGNDA